ncbi:protein TANC1-like [Ursus maritimus]|uniref:Protein TANC1-like n=1 Tax=Ursus maritimus TaxID=29073 RepID=A0A8M1GKZ5_URSMA|nr:protein TANC1-like [Ursus maritimus]
MQHIRIMEGMSRSLPSSPLLTHQSISVRLQPVKKLTAPLRKAKFVESPRIPESELGSPTLASAQKLDVDAYCPGKHACKVSALTEGGLDQAHPAEQCFACILFIKTYP